MKSISNYINRPIEQDNSNRTDEFFLLSALVATAVLAQFTSEMMHFTPFIAAGNLAGSFFDVMTAKLKKKKEKIENGEDNKEKKEKLSPTQSSDMLLALAKKSNNNSPAGAEKTQNDNMLKLLYACSFDKDGKEIPFEERGKKLQEMLPEDQYKALQKAADDKYKELSKDDKIKDEIKKEAETFTADDLKSFKSEAQTSAKSTWTEVEEKKKKDEELDKKIEDLEKQIQDEQDEDKKKDLQKSLEDVKTEKANNQISAVKEINKDNKSNQKTSGDKDTEVEKDKDGNVIKQEEVTDPKTGEKKKVITHTGPRGGKFYYPDGKPKTPEHKVYVKENYELTSYLKSKMI